MAHYPNHLYCQRIDAAKQIAGYYGLTIEPTLFGSTAVILCLGRVGENRGKKI